MVYQIQEAQIFPHRINQRTNTPKYILIKLTKTKYKERVLNASREKQVTYKINPKSLKLIFQQKLCRPEGNGRIYLKY